MTSDHHREIIVTKPGGHDVLAIVDKPRRALGSHDIRVAVGAIGINYADCAVRMGVYSAVSSYPVTPGFEVAGRVTETGSAATRFQVGDEVVALTRFGGYTTELVTDEGLCMKPPHGHDLEQAAGFPAVHLTAWHALCDLANVREGQSVLIHSAAGGVGLAATRFATGLGARVVGVIGGPQKRNALEEAGAHDVIDKSAEDLWNSAERLAPEGYDIILDANGVATLKQSYEHLALSGRLIVYGFATMLPRVSGKPSKLSLALAWLRTPRFSPFALCQESRSVMGFNLVYHFERTDHFQSVFEELAAWAERGSLPPGPVEAFSFDDVARAHARLESGKTTGKLVLVP